MFFFYRIGSRSEYNLGKFLHRNRPYDVFRLFCRILSGEQNARFPVYSDEDRTRAFAYILGYIAHYATDSTFHPFVYNYMEEEKSEKRVHQLIENDWDVHFLRKFRGREAEKFRCAFSPKKIAKNAAVARLYACLAEELGREEVKRANSTRAQQFLAVSHLLPREVLFLAACMGETRTLFPRKALPLLPLPAQAP